MEFTAADVVTDARVLLNDTRSSSYRYSDDQMLGFFNDAMRRLFMLRPDAFQVTIGHNPTPNNTQQTVPQDQVFLGINYITLVDAGPEAHRAVREVSWDDFTNAQIRWVGGPAGIPNKYIKDRHNPRNYFLNPRPINGLFISLFVGMSPSPATSLNAEYTRPVRWFVPALVDCVVFLASSIDDEHVSSGRAKLFYDSFVNQLGAGEQIVRRNSLEPIAGFREIRNDAQ